MLDDFREQAKVSTFEEEAPPPEVPVETRRLFLGMTPAQRFVISAMLLALVCLLGVLLLLVMEKIVLPFL